MIPLQKFEWIKERRIGRLATDPISLKAKTSNFLTLMDNDYHDRRELVDLCLQTIDKEEPSLLFVSCNPLSSAVAASRVSTRSKLPFVVEFRDPWIDNPFRVWQTWLHFVAESYLERNVYSRADHLVFNTRQAAKMMLTRQAEISSSKVSVIPHSWSKDRFENSETGRLNTKDNFVIAVGGGSYQPIEGGRSRWKNPTALLKYKRAGALSVDKDRSSLRPLFFALASVLDTRPNLRGKIEIRFLRDLSSRDREFIEELGIQSYVRCLGGVKADRVPKVLSEVDCLYLNNIVFCDNERSPFVASRTFDYLASRKPILTYLPPGEGRDFVKESGLGFFADPFEDKSVCSILGQLVDKHFGKGISVNPNERFIRDQESAGRIAQLAQILYEVRDSS